VQAIRENNLTTDKWTTDELNMMIQWHKCPEDSVMPSKKAEELARYFGICGHGKSSCSKNFRMHIHEKHQNIKLHAPLPLAEPDLDINDTTASAV
jgi:hypothetical protein